MIEIGRVCVKTAGREIGRFCVVIKKMDDNFVLVTGPKSLTKVKRRRCNVDHLEPLGHKIGIKSDASDSDVEQELKKGKVLARIQAEAAEALKKVREESSGSEATEPAAKEPESVKKGPKEPKEKPKAPKAEKPAKPKTPLARTAQVEKPARPHAKKEKK